MIYRVRMTTGYADTYFDFKGGPTDAVQFMRFATMAYNPETSDKDKFEISLTLVPNDKPEEDEF